MLVRATEFDGGVGSTAKPPVSKTGFGGSNPSAPAIESGRNGH